MPPEDDSAARWRARAAEARSLAGQLAHPEARRQMLEIAEAYERMAHNAELCEKKPK